jgi:hypothetical protein
VVNLLAGSDGTDATTTVSSSVDEFEEGVL